MTTTTVSHPPKTYNAADFEKINNQHFQAHNGCGICKIPNNQTEATKVELVCKHVFCKDCADLLTPRSNKRFRACLLCKEDRMPVRYFSKAPEGLKIELNPELVSITLTTAYVAAQSSLSPTFKEMHDAALHERIIQQEGGPRAALHAQAKMFKGIMERMSLDVGLARLRAMRDMESTGQQLVKSGSDSTATHRLSNITKNLISSIVKTVRDNLDPLQQLVDNQVRLERQIVSSRASDVLAETTTRRESESDVEGGVPQLSNNGASSTPSSDKNLPK